MKKFLAMITLCLGLTLIAGIALAAQNYSVFSLPTPCRWLYSGDVAKTAALRVVGAYPTTGTVILSRVSGDLATTTTLFTVTCVAGAYDADLGTGTNFWLQSGDYLLRSGTVTNNSQCLLFLTN
jgi:hypothetical protein